MRLSGFPILIQSITALKRFAISVPFSLIRTSIIDSDFRVYKPNLNTTQVALGLYGSSSQSGRNLGES